jgi:hypothetical protein
MNTSEAALRDTIADLYQRARAKAENHVRSSRLWPQYKATEVAYETVLKLMDAESNRVEAARAISEPGAGILRVDIVDLILERMAAACPHGTDEDHGHCVRCSVLWEVKEQLTAYIAGDSVLNSPSMGTAPRAALQQATPLPAPADKRRWFYHRDLSCVHPHSVMAGTEETYVSVCSSLWNNKLAIQTMKDIAAEHNAALDRVAALAARDAAKDGQ